MLTQQSKRQKIFLLLTYSFSTYNVKSQIHRCVYVVLTKNTFILTYTLTITSRINGKVKHSHWQGLGPCRTIQQ